MAKGERMVSIRIEVPESLREAFGDLCRKHKPRVSINAALSEYVSGVVSGEMPLPAKARDRRYAEKSEDTSDPAPRRKGK